MFNKSIVLAATMIVAGGLALSGPASAAHRMFMPPMGGGMGGISEFHRGGGDGWRHDHDHDHDHFRFYGPVFGFGYSPFYDDYAYGDDDYTPPYSYAYAGGSHVQWCLDRYRTYDPRSNTYVGNDGYRHACTARY